MNMTSLHDVLTCHGISLSDSSLKDSQDALIHHLVNGHCAHHVCNRKVIPDGCGYIAGRRKSPVQLSIDILNGIRSILGNPSYDLLWFRRICNGLPQVYSHPQIVRKNDRRRQLLAFIDARLQFLTEQTRILSSFSIGNAFQNFDKVLKPTLICLVIAHGLNVEKNASVKDLREILTKHLTEGYCISDHDVPYEGCSNVCSEYHDSVSPVPSTDTESTLQLKIFILSSVVNRIQSRALRHLLVLHDVPFEAHFNTAKL